MKMTYVEHVAKMQEIKAKTTWLQGIGAHEGKPAGQIQVGDVLVWNYGYTSEVVAIESETKTTVTVKVRSEGKDFSRRMKKDRIVAIQGMPVWSATQEQLRYA